MSVVVVSGGTKGMGYAFARGRAERGDRVVVLGRSPAALPAGVEFIRADLSRVAENRRVIDELLARYQTIDALTLFANGLTPRRTVTDEGLERVFALYYVSRYVLSFGLLPALERAASPVIVNVAGVGVSRGEVHWDDLTLARRYSMVTAQLQAGRANDLLGVGFARRAAGRARYVLYHPGFTRSGDRGALSPVVRGLLGALARFAAQPVADAVAPIHGFLDQPSAEPLLAVDRGRRLPLTLPTLDPSDADRLMDVTGELMDERLRGDNS